MSFDVVLEGNIYLKEESEIVKACIGIENGKIKALKKILKGYRNLDFSGTGNLILPAGVDIHVHFREPGMVQKEDFFTGTLSSAFGGVTCVFDMPNTVPVVSTVKILKEKLALAKSKACVDFGLYASGMSNINELEALAKLAHGFKIYLYEIEDYANLNDNLKAIAELKKRLLVHAEDKTLLSNDPAKNIEDYLRARPRDAEVSAIKKILAFSSQANKHICHVSAKESIEVLKNISTRGITAEITMHHLLLNTQSKFELEAFGKVNPPLRAVEDNEALWEALKTDKTYIVASDHAPHLLEDKKDFEIASPGLPGVETAYPLLLYCVKAEKISLSRAVEAYCEMPAAMFNLSKGKIAVGYDADLIVVNLKKITKIRDKNLHSKCGWSAFENFSAIFPSYTFLRGIGIIENFEFVGSKGLGGFVTEQEQMA